MFSQALEILGLQKPYANKTILSRAVLQQSFSSLTTDHLVFIESEIQRFRNTLQALQERDRKITLAFIIGLGGYSGSSVLSFYLLPFLCLLICCWASYNLALRKAEHTGYMVVFDELREVYMWASKEGSNVAHPVVKELAKTLAPHVKPATLGVIAYRDIPDLVNSSFPQHHNAYLFYGEDSTGNLDDLLRFAQTKSLDTLPSRNLRN